MWEAIIIITEQIKDHVLRFETDKTSFSPSAIDKGTLAMLSQVEFSPDDKVLDLGCGYGVVRILAAKFTSPQNVYMSDINSISIKLSQKNADLNGVGGVNIIKSDGFYDIDEAGFTIILTNPPYHTDFSIAKHFIEKGFNRLLVGGRMLMVTKRKEWYKNKLIAIFGGVRITEIDGYCVFTAEKRSHSYANAKNSTNTKSNQYKKQR